MRSLIVLACAAAGILGGGALIGLAALGGCLIFVSLGAAAYGVLTYDWPDHGTHAASRPQQPTAPVFLEDYLQRKAAENW